MLFLVYLQNVSCSTKLAWQIFAWILFTLVSHWCFIRSGVHKPDMTAPRPWHDGWRERDKSQVVLIHSQHNFLLYRPRFQATVGSSITEGLNLSHWTTKQTANVSSKTRLAERKALILHRKQQQKVLSVQSAPTDVSPWINVTLNVAVWLVLTLAVIRAHFSNGGTIWNSH